MGFDSNTGGGGGSTRGRGRMTYAERERRIKKNTQRKRDRERERDGGNTMISARGRKEATGRRETSVVRGFGLARSTRYPYSWYLRVLPYPVLASIRTSLSPSPWRARARHFPLPPGSPPGGRRSRSQSRLSRVDSFRSPISVPPPRAGIVVLASEPRYAPATVTSL